MNIEIICKIYDLPQVYEAIKTASVQNKCQIKSYNIISMMAFDAEVMVPKEVRCNLSLNSGEEFSISLREVLAEDNIKNLDDRTFVLNFEVEPKQLANLKVLINQVQVGLKKCTQNRLLNINHFYHLVPNSNVQMIERVPMRLLPSIQKMINELDGNYRYLNRLAMKESHIVTDQNNAKEKLFFNFVSVFQSGEKLFGLFISDSDDESTLLSSKKNGSLNLICSELDLRWAEETIVPLLRENTLKQLSQSGGKYNGQMDIVTIREPIEFDDLVLEEKTKKDVEQNILNFFSLRKQYKSAGLPFKRGIAIYGPPGTGKTTLSRYLVFSRPETVIWVKAGDLESNDDLERIFKVARLAAPSIIIFEDFDFYAISRDLQRSSTVASLMSFFDGIEENDGIMIIVTTNMLETIEKAIVDRPGRIDCKIWFGDLGSENIELLLKRKLSKFKKEFASFKEVIPPHSTLSGAAIMEIISSVLRSAIRVNSENIVLKKEYFTAAWREIDRHLNTQKKVSGFK